MWYPISMHRRTQKRKGLAFVEVMIACLLLAVILLPMFNFLTSSVKDTETTYAEVIAISRAKMIMDTLLYQVPWRAIRQGNPCTIDDPKDEDEAKAFFKDVIPDIFGEGCSGTGDGNFIGDGIYTSEAGFKFRARVKVVDLDHDSMGSQELTFTVRTNGGDHKSFKFNEITSKDADGKYNLVKKIVVQVKWSLAKGKDPHDDPHAKSIFLVGFKSNLEG